MQDTSAKATIKELTLSYKNKNAKTFSPFCATSQSIAASHRWTYFSARRIKRLELEGYTINKIKEPKPRYQILFSNSTITVQLDREDKILRGWLTREVPPQGDYTDTKNIITGTRLSNVIFDTTCLHYSTKSKVTH